MYNWPSYSTEANLMNRRSRDVNFTAFSESSCNKTKQKKKSPNLVHNVRKRHTFNVLIDVNRKGLKDL